MIAKYSLPILCDTNSMEQIWMTVRCLPGERASVLGKYHYDTLAFTSYMVISQGDVCIL